MSISFYSVFLVATDVVVVSFAIVSLWAQYLLSPTCVAIQDLLAHVRVLCFGPIKHVCVQVQLCMWEWEYGTIVI